MTLETARKIYKNMRDINPLLDELHKRFELAQPTSGCQNIESNSSNLLSKQAQQSKTQPRSLPTGSNGQTA